MRIIILSLLILGCVPPLKTDCPVCSCPQTKVAGKRCSHGWINARGECIPWTKKQLGIKEKPDPSEPPDCEGWKNQSGECVPWTAKDKEIREWVKKSLKKKH